MIPNSLYAQTKALVDRKGVDWIKHTANRILDFREWVAAPDEVEEAVDGLGVRYIPNSIIRDGAFFFPCYDPLGYLSMAQLRYVDPEWQKSKTMTIGSMNEHEGPLWVGADKTTLGLISGSKSVVLVEGPFDVLATRIILGPSVPVMSPLGHNINHNHQKDMMLMGVEHCVVMFDNDKAGRSGTYTDLPVKRKSSLQCPKNDPSECLKSLKTAKLLRAEFKRVMDLREPLSGEELDQLLTASEKTQ